MSSAREKLNLIAVVGALIVGALIGGACESLTVFFVVTGFLLLLAVCEGGIRPPRGRW
jgi:hypothetical protein